MKMNIKKILKSVRNKSRNYAKELKLPDNSLSDNIEVFNSSKKITKIFRNAFSFILLRKCGK